MNYREMEERILRQMAASMGLTKDMFENQNRSGSYKAAADAMKNFYYGAQEKMQQTVFVDEKGHRFKVINPDVYPTPHPKPRQAVLVEVTTKARLVSDPRTFWVRMPSGQYLAKEDGSDYELVETVPGRLHHTEEHFDKVHANFRRFWP